MKITERINSFSSSVMDIINGLPEPVDGIAYVAMILFSGSLIIYIAIVMPFSIMVKIHSASLKETCLESQVARRYKSFVCEEYHDGRWVEVDPGVVYYYNSAAAHD